MNAASDKLESYELALRSAKLLLGVATTGVSIWQRGFKRDFAIRQVSEGPPPGDGWREVEMLYGK